MSEDAAPVRLETIERVAWIYERLAEAYGVPEWRPNGDPLGELIATILSQHTSDVNSERAYKALRERFPMWVEARDAPVEEVAASIRSGGLAEVKAERIQNILHLLTKRLGGAPLTLDFLADQSMDEADAYLRSLPGVGPKTAACVLLFALGKPAFPVDTHVWRVTRRLGLIGAKVSADAAHDALERMIPPAWRYAMHINLIRHGRRICAAQRPACERCPLRAGCAYYWELVAQADGA
jgi:endonuclease-3